MKMRGSSKLLEGGHQMKFSKMGAQTFHENVAYKLYEEELARITRDPLEIPPSACCPEILRTKSKPYCSN
jgi:hypothetical protein